MLTRAQCVEEAIEGLKYCLPVCLCVYEGDVESGGEKVKALEQVCFFCEKIAQNGLAS